MRCEKCKYKYIDYVENNELCIFFGYGDSLDKNGKTKITVNSKGEEGCKYNKKTLDNFLKGEIKNDN